MNYPPDPTFKGGTVTAGIIGNAMAAGPYTMGAPQPQVLGQQQLWPESSFWIAVHKARNGHVVRMARHIGEVADLWIVPDGQSVPDTIAAAIAAHTMER